MCVPKKDLEKLSKMDLLEDLEMSLLNLSFFMICIIQILVLLKNNLNYLKDNIVKSVFLRSIIYFFLQHLIMEILSLKEENIIKGKINLFRL